MADTGESEAPGQGTVVREGASTSNTTFSHCSDIIHTGNIYARGDVSITQTGSQDVLTKKADLIMEKTVKRFKTWTKNMVKTAAYHMIMEKLNAGSTWITIIGSPGEGKTTTAYLALQTLHKQGKKVFQLWSPKEYSDVTLSCSCPVIMLDDIFGDLDFDQSKLDTWKTVLHDILDEKEHYSHDVYKTDLNIKAMDIDDSDANDSELEAMETDSDIENVEMEIPKSSQESQEMSDKNIVVIMVGRDYILKTASRHIGRLATFVTERDIDLSHPVLRSQEEKISIWNALVAPVGIKLKESQITELCKINSGHGFPHVCRLFAQLHKGSTMESAVAFFQAPLQFLNQTIMKLVTNQSVLTLFQEIIKRGGKIQGRELEQIDGSINLRQTAEQMTGTYLRKERGSYLFDHPSVYESVAYNICLTSPLFVIQHCDASFIHQRLRLSVLKEKNKTQLNLVVYISEDYFEDLAKRFAKDISSGNLLHILSHEACTYKTFVKMFMTQLSLPIQDLLKVTDKMTGQSFLQLIPSNKSRQLLMYIDSKTQEIRNNRTAIQTLLFSVIKYTASDVLLYMAITYAKFDINCKNMFRITPLMEAAETGDSGFVNHIMAMRPDLLERGLHEQTALHYLCKNGHVSAVRQAIKNGTDINVTDLYENSLLDAAVHENQMEVVKLLLDTRKKNPTKAMNIDRSLYIASIYSDNDMISLLIDNGASVNKANRQGSTPLHELCEGNKFKAVLSLLKHGADVMARNKDGSTPLHKAADGGHRECIDVMIRVGSDVNTQDRYGSSPLHIAAGKGYRTCAEMLLKSGASVNIQNKYGSPPLHESAYRGFTQCVSILLKASADVNIQNENGFTPLHSAADMGYPECVDLLVKAMANVNLQNANGFTPLHSAAYRGNADCIDLLINSTADLNVRDNFGFTAVGIAKRLGFTDCVSSLAEGSTSLMV